MTTTADLLIEHPLPGVALLTLNRPARRNALTMSLMADLARTLRELGRDGRTGCVVLTGTPPAFCAGGDLVELRHADAERYAAYCGAYATIADAIRGMACPLIASVNGAAVAGGLELMCLADLRIASSEAFMLAGDADLGLPTTSGLSWLLPRLVGAGRARWILYLSDRIGADEALQIGLVEEVRPPEALLDFALDAAARIAAKPGQGIALTRRLVADAATGSHADAVAAELAAQRIGFAHPDVAAVFAAERPRRLGQAPS